MLLVDDEEFDARRLEELAESLLADITADLEAGTGTCDEAPAQIAGDPERLSGSMVGPAAECMESGGNRAGGLNHPTINEDETKAKSILMHITTPATAKSSPSAGQVSKINENLQQRKLTTAKGAISSLAPTKSTSTTVSAAAFLQSATPDTVYGTYDAKTNSITIVMDGDAVPVNEAVEEIYGEGVSAGDDTTDVIMKCPPPATSPSQVYLNVINATEESDDEATSHLDFEPMEKFLRPRHLKPISPIAKSPVSVHSATSDHGYESVIGSPASTTLAHLDTDASTMLDDEDFPWESNFDELFPNLI